MSDFNPDFDGDGKVTEKEFELFERKIIAKRRMATASIVAMIMFTAFLMSPIVPVERVDALSDIFSMFYITMGGVVAAFFGVSAWMGKK